MFGLNLGILASSGTSGNSWAAWDGSKDGSFSTIASGQSVDNMYIYTLSTNLVVGVWRNGNNGTVHAATASISGNSLTWNSDVASGSINTGQQMSVCMLSSTELLVAFVSNGNSPNFSHPRAFTIDISGTTPSFNAVISVDSVNCDYVSVDTISTSNAIITYNQTGSANGNSAVLSISGGVVTPNAIFAFASGTAAAYCNVSVISSSQALVVYFASSLVKAQVLAISGTTITGNMASTLTNTTNTTLLYMTRISSTTFILIANNGGNSQPYACVVTVSGTSSSNGSRVLIWGASTTFGLGRIGACKINATEVMVLYQQDSANTDIWGVVGDISGSTLTLNTPVRLTSIGSCDSPACYSIDSSHIGFAFHDGTNTIAKGSVLSIV